MHSARLRPGVEQVGRATIVIGLVNNMPATAFHSAETQFAELLHAAASTLAVPPRIELRRFAFRPVPDPRYSALDALWRSDLDALIVTGSPPEAAAMADEPVLPLMAQLADWAAGNTLAAIWSCFAAHAVVHLLDGVPRNRLPAKLSGVFTCQSDADCPAGGIPLRWPVPHSRYNDLHVAALERAGYRIVSRGPGALAASAQRAGRPVDATTDGADSFERVVGRSRFLMLQGHPEYGPTTLLREYRRDVRRALAQPGQAWPAVPSNTLDIATMAALADVKATAPGHSAAEVLSALDLVLQGPQPAHWRASAAHMFGGWLAELTGRQAETAFVDRLAS